MSGIFCAHTYYIINTTASSGIVETPQGFALKNLTARSAVFLLSNL